jgi:hypothetical protein
MYRGTISEEILSRASGGTVRAGAPLIMAGPSAGAARSEENPNLALTD